MADRGSVNDGELRPTVSVRHVIGGFAAVALVFANKDALPESLRDVTVAAAAAVSLLSVAVFGRARQEGRARRLADERFGRTWALIVLFGIAGLVATLTTDSDSAVALLAGVGSGLVLLVITLHGAISHRSAASGGPGQAIRAK